MLSDADKERLDIKFAGYGYELMKTAAPAFDNVVGGNYMERGYAQEWFSRETRRRENTAALLDDGGKDNLRRAVMNRVYEVTEEGTRGYPVHAKSLADDMELDFPAVSKALDYFEGEGLLSPQGVMAYEMTHRGIVEIERWRTNPSQSTTHFPAITINQNISNFGGNQAVSVGDHNSITQTTTNEYPSDIKSFADRLSALDGGKLSKESTDLLQKITDSDSALQIAAPAEIVAKKSNEHKTLLSALKEETEKKLAEKIVDQGVSAASWVYTHGHILVAALSYVMHSVK